MGNYFDHSHDQNNLILKTPGWNIFSPIFRLQWCKTRSQNSPRDQALCEKLQSFFSTPGDRLSI